MIVGTISDAFVVIQSQTVDCFYSSDNEHQAKSCAACAEVNEIILPN